MPAPDEVTGLTLRNEVLSRARSRCSPSASGA